MAGGPTHEIVRASLYFHIPVCRERCDYCDFFTRTHVGTHTQVALIDRAIEQYGEYAHAYGIERPATMYIGGGTPSALHDEALDRLLRFTATVSNTRPTFPIETTFEVNPEDLDSRILERLAASGVNRLSLGVQSLDADTLHAIGRHTSLADTRRGIDLVAERWPGSWSADAITAVPGQDRRQALADLMHIVDYAPSHVSLYELELVPETVLGHAVRRGRLAPPDERIGESTLIACGDLLEEHGYRQYEVSNFSRPGARSEHNSRYWRLEPYVGVGPGAVGTLPSREPNGLPLRLNGTRNFRAFRDRPDYGVVVERLSAIELCREQIMTAFRTADGLSVRRFESVFGYRPTDAFPKTLDRWRSRILVGADSISLDRRGVRLVDSFVRDAFVELDENPPPLEVPRWPAEAEP